MSHQSQPPPSQWHVMAAVGFYLASSLSMVLANKWVLKTTRIPLTFLLFQLFISVLLLCICRIRMVYTAIPALRFRAGPTPEWSTTKALWPMITLNFFSLCFNTFTLLFVDASFYQVARGLVLPFTVMNSLIFLHSRPSLRTLLACGVVTLGFLIGVGPSTFTRYSESGITPIGVFFGLAGSMTTGLHVVIIKSSLSAVGNSAMDLSWYSNVLTSVLLIPLIVVIGEVKELHVFLTQSTSDEIKTFIIGTLITGVLGFLISVAGILSVKITSPMTHMVSSAVKGVLQTVGGVWFFGEIITVTRASSILTILAGSVWYTWIKHAEGQSKAPPSSVSMPLMTANGRSRDEDEEDGDIATLGNKSRNDVMNTAERGGR